MSERAEVLIEIVPNDWHGQDDIDYVTQDWCEDFLAGTDWTAEIWYDDDTMMGSLNIEYPPSMTTRGYLDLDAWVDMVEQIVGRTKTLYKRARG